MMRFSAKFMCGALLVSLFSGCNVTFQSNQFNFVRGLFEQEEPVPEKNWEVRWQGRIYPVFAVNHDGGTFFADEHGLLVSFDGWQIRHVSISQAKNEIISGIEKSTADDGAISLDYSDGHKKRLALDRCQAWEQVMGIGWKQDCNGAGVSGGGYTNTIELNKNGELVALRFMILPGTDPMQIMLKQGRPAGND